VRLYRERIDAPAFPVTIEKRQRVRSRPRAKRGRHVKPAPFAYTKARTLKEAVTLLARHKDDARLLAGGQSLIATLNMRLSAPELLIDINGIKGLDGIAKKGKFVEIGALARHAQLERSDIISRHAPLIALAMPHIGHPAIRNRGTFGGSIAFADPAAELPACIVALGGEIDIAGPRGKRKVNADAFFKGLLPMCGSPTLALAARQSVPKRLRLRLLPAISTPPSMRLISSRPTMCKRRPR
jgi:carbon-monoxide dehydrogenase medium subunit